MPRFLLVFLLVLGSCVPAAWSATAQLVGQWGFEEGCAPAIDASGMGNHGSIVGCTFHDHGGLEPIGDRPDSVGQFSLIYDANVDRVDVGTAGWLATAGTVALWVKPSQFPSGDHYFFGHTTSPAFANRIQLYSNTSTGELDIGLGNNHSVAANVAVIPLNVWTHIALTWNNGVYVAYVNGLSVQNGSYSGLTAIGPVAHLGNNGNQASANAGFWGLLDDVHVYNAALPLTDIQALAGVTGGGGPAAIEGFAAAAVGGEAFKDSQTACSGLPCVVTNCFADNPPATPRVGSLRWATGTTGNKYIKINVACPTPVDFENFFVYVRSKTTIDATNAPAPGFQYIGTINIDGKSCSPSCNDIVVKGLIYRGDGTQASCSGVAMRVERGGRLVVFDRNTFYKCSNDCIGVTSNDGTNFLDSHDITISNNAIIKPLRPGNPSVPGSGCPADATSEYGAKTALIFDNRPRHISLIRNFFEDVNRRIPWMAYADTATPNDTMLDMRNNLLVNVGGESSRDGGAWFRDHATANVVNNYFSMRSGLSTSAQKRAIIVCKSSGIAAEDVSACGGESPVDAIYAAGNVHAQGFSTEMDAKRTTTTALTAPLTNTVDACTAAQQVIATAGAPQRSSADQAAFNSVSLDACAAVEPAPTINVFSANPQTITVGNSSTLSWNATNAINGCSINQGVGTVCSTEAACNAGGTTGVSPTANTTYTLTCTNVSGSPTAQATVTVNPAVPNINVFAANPTTIVQGNSSTLSWDATNAINGCSINQGVGTVCASATACETGGTTVRSPTVTTTYTLTCTNVSGTDTAQATITVNPAVPNINVFSANPASITSGNSSTLSWDATNAINGCSINQGIGTVCSTATACETGGTTVRSPTATTTYTLTCTNVSGTDTAQATVTVNPVGPNINVFSANPTTIVQGNSSTLSWDASNATSGCSINQGIGTVCATATTCETGGTTLVSPTANTTYTLTCTNVSGSPTAQATVTVNPAVPTINVFAANPTTIVQGNSSTLSWDATNAISGCSINQGIGTVCATSTTCETGGTTTVFPTATTTYTLTCTNVSGSPTAQAAVTVNPVAPTINVFAANPTTIVQGNSSTLSWDASNAINGCSINQGIGTVCATATTCETGGTTSVTPTATTIYTMTCTNVSGSPTAQATVTVTPAPPPVSRRLPWIGG